jgi:hypothetical protein
MGAGFAQIGLLLLLTVVGLPLFFFGLMAALDKFEHSLTPQPRVAVTPPAPESSATASSAADSSAGGAPASQAAVVALPTAAATPAATASKSAATV